MPDAAEMTAYKAALGIEAAEPLKLRLCTNVVTPSESRETADFTIPTYTGYADVSLVGSSYVESPGDPTGLTYPPIQFTTTDDPGQAVTGWLLIRQTSEELYDFEMFPSPITVSAANTPLVINLPFTMPEQS